MQRPLWRLPQLRWLHAVLITVLLPVGEQRSRPKRRRTGSSARPRWSGAGSSVAYTTTEVLAPTPVCETVEKLAPLPEGRDFFPAMPGTTGQGPLRNFTTCSGHAVSRSGSAKKTSAWVHRSFAKSTPAELPVVVLSAFEHRLDRTAPTYLSFMTRPSRTACRRDTACREPSTGGPSALHRRGAARDARSPEAVPRLRSTTRRPAPGRALV
jgi:hypothetical protein